MGSGYWSGVCSAAVNRPINEKNMITNGLSGVLLALYCITAIASIFRLVQFSLLNSEQRTMVWMYFGKFNALLTAASVAGAVAWASFAQNTITISSTYSTIFNNTLATGNFEQFSAIKRQVAQANLWSAFFFSFSAFEFAMISIAQLLVLDRLRMFISKTQPSSKRRLYKKIWRASLAMVAVANTTAVIGSIASACLYGESSALFSSVADNYAAGDNITAVSLNAQADAKVLNASHVTSIQVSLHTQTHETSNHKPQTPNPKPLTPSTQLFCEVIILVIVLASYAFFGLASLKRVREALRSSTSAPRMPTLVRDILARVFLACDDAYLFI